MIVIIGGAAVLGAGLLAALKMPLANAEAFMEFAGAFGWKVIVGAVATSGGVKIAQVLRPGTNSSQ